MIESATGPLLLCKSKSPPTQKCHAPPAVAESSRFIDTVNPNNSAIFVKNRSFQIVPKQKGAMNTLISGMGVPVQGTPISPLIGDSFAHQYSASVPERVFPYRHIEKRCISVNRNLTKMFM